MKPIPSRLVALVMSASLLVMCLPPRQAGAAQVPNSNSAPSNRWEGEIRKFEELDQKTPPPAGGVVFVGSSSIRLWKLAESFPGKNFINRGFGGSQLADSTYFAERIVLPYRPRVVVMYAGDNDIAAGKLPTDIAADFEAFATKIHRKLPATRIMYIAIKPSIARWKLVDKIRETNELISQFCGEDSRLSFVPIFEPMLSEDHMPRVDLFVEDGLHLSPRGYELWSTRVELMIDAALDDAPSLILHHGKVVTVDSDFQIAEAVAVRGDRIVRVGTNGDLMKLANERTRLIDLGGKTLLPGLIDSHVHPAGASMHEFDHEVPDMDSVADVLDYVASRTRAVPDGEWIWVNQIFITRLKEQRFPTRRELDAVAPKHPVVFATGPDAMVNSLALQLSGIDRQFAVTGTGQIERDENGELTGMLRGGTKRYLKGAPTADRATEQDRDDRLVALLKDYNSVGITCIADRNAGRNAVEQYERLRNSGRLTTRVAISHAVAVDSASQPDKVREVVEEIGRHPLRHADPMLRIVGIKTFLDGGMLTGSAYMRKPWGVSRIYSISDPEYRGVRFIPPELLVSCVDAAVDSGLQFTAHSVGDGAVHALLDAYETVNQTKPIRSTRPCITHCNFMSREAIEQMIELGVVADLQPAWLYLDARTLTAQFGDERLRYFQPLSSLFAAGVTVGGGSDHMQKIGSLRSINPYNPFLGMWVTVSRRAKWFEGSLHPEERLTREQAIRFYTINNAYLVFLEHQIGSIEPGKLADLIVLDRDILSCAEEEIRETRVLRTYFAGKEISVAE